MKTNVTQKVHVDQRLLQEIRTQVAETLATGAAFGNRDKKRVFSTVDLWNIHNRRRQRATRRFL